MHQNRNIFANIAKAIEKNSTPRHNRQHKHKLKKRGVGLSLQAYGLNKTSYLPRHCHEHQHHDHSSLLG